MRPKTPLRHKITLALFGLFLFLVLLEMGLRLGGFIYVTLQENRNRASLRRGGEFRILCLGDSMTASGQDPYPQQLEEILNERDIGIEFSVINKAVPSTTSSMILLQLENNILKYKPQMVLAMMGINDEGEHMLYAQAPSSRLFSWMRYSRAYKLTRLIWLRLAAKIKEYLPPIRVNLGLERCYAQEANGVNSKSETQYVELGKAYVRQGNYTQAEETIKKALEINPRSDSAYVELAWCYNRQGEFSRAEDAFKKALEVNPRNDNAYLWRGRMYSGSFNNNIQAVIFFKRAIEINPTNADACIELAGIYVTEGKYIQAKDLLSKSLAQHPEDERTQRALGVLNAQINNRDSGKELPDSIIDKSAQSYKIMTRQSYLKLKEVLDSRGIQLVCVQYPMRSIRALKNIFEWQEGAIFVDNERVFKEALKEAPYEQYFIDMFAGDFGHCTHKGEQAPGREYCKCDCERVFSIRIGEFMRLALIFPPFSYKLHEENLRVVVKYFGIFPPMSLAWVAAIAERNGHDVIIIDARTLKLSKEEVLRRLKEFRPDIMGFMMTTYMYRETLGWVSFLKKELKIPVVIGGFNLHIYPKESVAPPEIDFGVLDSAFYTLPRLLRELEENRRFECVPGLIYKDGDSIVITPSGSEPDNFDAYPYPARHLLPNEMYAEFPSERKNFTIMVTSRGCPRRCYFCEEGGVPFSSRTPMTVVNEMEECYKKYNIREIDIFDVNFTWDRARAMTICDEIIRRRLDITWACRSRIDLVDAQMLKKMRKSGCARIYYGIESGDQEMLDRLNKGITLEQIRSTVEITRETGIKALGFFLIGSPGETKETVRKTVKFAKKLKLDYIQFSKTTAKPMTGLWRDLVKDTKTDYWRDYILGLTEEKALPRPWTELTNEEIDYLAKKAYIDYCTGPLFLLRSAIKVKSIKELKRKVLALLSMIFFQERKAEKWLRRHAEYEAYNENF